MHPESGFAALQTAQLVEEFKKISRPDDQNMTIMAKQGKIYYEDSALEEWESVPEDRPEVDRTLLRQILLDSLLPGTVKWAFQNYA